jgi:predicted metal-dependent HD superfamily phosphohydrolase
MNYPSLLEYVKRKAVAIFRANADSGYVYHNLGHTESVVGRATEIAQHYQLNERDLFIVIIAAWFHDIGYFNGGKEGHEIRSAVMAEDFLGENQVSDEALIDAVKSCILATITPQNPNSLPEQIVCDADLFHLGTDEFFERNKLVHKEAEITAGKEIGKKEWRRNTIHLLENHHYFTDYCRSLLNEKKQYNLEKLIKKEADKKKDNHTKEHEYPNTSHFEEQPENKNPESKEHVENYNSAGQGQTKKSDFEQAGKPKKKKSPEKGIDTLFKITSNNNQRLSRQADSKAHIMIQVNSIIISVLISMLFRKIEEYRYLVVPAVVLLGVNVVTIIFSVLATRPQIPGGTFSKQDIDDKKVNLLFFGNFYKMTLEDYASGMLALMDEYDFLYLSLIRDVYSQGKVLSRKYHLLRISYNVFMYGLVLSVAAFMTAFLFFSGK